MVGAPAAADAVARAQRLPGLRVGLHLVLVEGRPVLPPDELPDLVDRRGHFHDDMLRTSFAILLPRVHRQLEAEIQAQFAAFRATGLTLDHVNAHKHFQLHPTIAGLTLRIGRKYGLAAMRMPFEPMRVLDRIESGGRRLAATAVAPWAALLRARLRASGIAVPDQVFGLAWSGAMTESRVQGLLANLPEGVSEIYAHPATAGGFIGAAPGYRYADELAALTAPASRAAAAASGARMGGFADLPH
ncbi:MAG: hypothetical protein QOK29_2172 [Rhodospirillaceae bacterium]|nr:hypothetical protein [Rhodospirillaceae bacterium]